MKWLTKRKTRENEFFLNIFDLEKKLAILTSMHPRFTCSMASHLPASQAAAQEA
jgi:hypothetical protein